MSPYCFCFTVCITRLRPAVACGESWVFAFQGACVVRPFRCPLQEITDDDDDATAPVSCFSCFALEILRCDGWGSVSRVFLVLSRGIPLELLLDRTIVHCVTAATDGSHLTMMNEQIPTGTSVFHRSTSLSGI